MIEPDDTIHFKPDDIPELAETQARRNRKRRKRYIPEPEDWRPFDVEW
jgi:hypothetical protein